MKRTYIAIDLKSFYASVECADRKLDPLTTNLVVADLSRTEKTICLAVSPSLKRHGISGRARLFEVVQRVKEVNRQRMSDAVKGGYIHKREDGSYHFSSSSFIAPSLDADPTLELSYIVAPPRMRLYEEYSTRIFSIYMKYIAPEDIHVYSVDEVFIDATNYLETYGMTARELTMTMIREVLYTTGVTATAGIGTNLYLAKIAMDIVAKHVPADRDGVRIAALDEMKYRELLWCHRPLTDFWRIGRGYAAKLAAMGLYTMGDIARASTNRFGEDMLYKTFGINAELLIDHAWGWEPTTIEAIKSYRPSVHSLSSGQVLKEPYNYEKGRLIVREMTELLALDLVRKGLVTNQMTLTIGYDRESLTVLTPGKTIRDTVYAVRKTGEPYTGRVVADPYGRAQPRYAHGTGNLERYTDSTRRIMNAVMELYTRIADPDLLIRRVNIAACRLIREEDVPPERAEQLSLFADYEAARLAREAQAHKDAREKQIQTAILRLQSRFGKSAVLKGMNLEEGATTIERNGQVGGHRAE
jgi:DNA polymerase V